VDAPSPADAPSLVDTPTAADAPSLVDAPSPGRSGGARRRWRPRGSGRGRAAPR
jgi:hypothetical protein